MRALILPRDPVWPNAPKAGAFLPLVLMLVVVLPWIHLVAHARMNADLAAAGLRALDLLTGDDSKPIEPRAVPPLPEWVQAVALSLPIADKSLAVAAPTAF